MKFAIGSQWPVFLLLLAQAGWATQPSKASVSERRAPGEHWQQVADRYERQSGVGSWEELSENARHSAVAREDLDLSEVPRWESPVAVPFDEVRDLRFLYRKTNPDFPRRLSWLYPDDGCYARAAWMELIFAKSGLAAPMKLFVFGDLAVKTANTPSGKVYWWYHVVPVVAASGEVYALDPAIDPERPLTIDEWIGKMTDKPASVRLALCDGSAYDPESPCRFSPGESETAEIVLERARGDENRFLDLEWSRLEKLGREPEVELGAHPPWLR